MPQDDCIGRWIKSVRVSDITGNTEVDPGDFFIELVNGVLTGRYVVGTVSQPLQVTCSPSGSLDFLTIIRPDGLRIITYSGRVVHDPLHDVHVIQRGRYIINSAVDLRDIDAVDTGDWSAEKPGGN